MATSAFQRVGWASSVTRTSRDIICTVATTLPKRYQHTIPEIPNVGSLRQQRLRRSRIFDAASQRRSIAFNGVFRAQEAQQQVAKSTPTSSEPKTQGTPSSPYNLQTGLLDEPPTLPEASSTPAAHQVDWTRSFQGLSQEAFSPEAAEVLLAPIPPGDIEVKPDGIIYLPEIKYRRILNKAFGPGAWGLAPRGETIVTARTVTREYALVVLGRLVSVARGEMEYFTPESIPNSVEGCKSNALMRCCKDLGIASELWDPRYIRKFMKDSAKEQWVIHQVTNKKKKLWMRKDDTVRYPFKVAAIGAPATTA